MGRIVVVIAAIVAVNACSRAPAAGADPGVGPGVGPGADPSAAAADDDDAPALPVVRDDSSSLLFSFVDASGRMVTVPVAAAVPEPARKRVLVVDLAKTPEQRQAHRYAFFADLTTADAAGNHPVVVVSRYDASAVGAGAVLAAVPAGAVVVYSATWCGYCKKAKAWLKAHDVAYVERDVEKTPGAQEELQKKLADAHVPGGGIPVVDFGDGNVVVGFDVAAFERLTQKK